MSEEKAPINSPTSQLEKLKNEQINPSASRGQETEHKWTMTSATTLENLRINNEFLDPYRLPRLDHEEIGNLSKSITRKLASQGKKLRSR